MLDLEKKKDYLIEHWIKNSIITDKALIKAFQELPRENFILKEYKDRAYDDYPLPILENQTISQPTTVMLMTQALELKKNDKILEIGTGSGYQAALISKIIGIKGAVVSTEIMPELIKFAKNNIKKLKIKNIKMIKSKDNEIGCKKYAKYDKIIVTAALPEIPPELYKQLKDNGIIVAPVGSEFSQEMLKIKKLFYNKYNVKRLGMFQFVPVRGKFGFM